jgi:hypothetical protein
VTAPRAGSFVVALALGLGASACGHKGPPLAPLRPIPAAVSDWVVEREGAAVRLRFTVPDGNADGSTPPAVDRVEIFAVTRPADAPPPTRIDLAVPANLIATISVRSPAPAKAGAPPDPRPAAGDVALFVDAVKAVGAGEAETARYYAAVPAAGRRRGPASPVLRVPLSAPPAAPAGLKADYTEQTLTLTWDVAAASTRFLVEETDEGGGGAKRLTDAPQDAVRFDLPVQFGLARCFTVRAVDAQGAVSVIGDPSPPLCVTPRDRFPPPVPAGLLAVAGDGAIELAWTGVTAPDLAGYIVMRGDGATGTLQRLTPAPITVASYRDTAVRAGATYVYAVIALDTATPPNASATSNRQVVAARTPAAGLHFRR